MFSFQFWICVAVQLVCFGTGAPHQKTMREPLHVPEDFHKIDSLEEELPGRSGLHPVPPETRENNHDVSQIQNADIDVKDILLRFFKKLKNHPEILQQLIESEEKRLLDGYEDILNLEQMDSSPDSVQAIENPIPVPYQSEKMVVKKGGSSQQDFGPEYDPRSAPGFSGPISGSDMNNNIPLVPAKQHVQHTQPSAQEIADLEKQQSPFINSLPIFDKLPNPPSDDKLTVLEKADSPPSVKSHKKISQASFDSNIEEIKHVPIREELASEVPPSLLADKKELREEAHQALKKAEAEALKTKKFQASLQKEQMEQMAKAQEDKQAKEVEEQKHQYEQQAQIKPVADEDQNQSEPSKDSESQQTDVDPYGYYYYYYNYPELAQQVFNDDSEESNESYQSEGDRSVSDSVGSSKQHDSSDSVKSDNNSEQTDDSSEKSYSSDSTSNESNWNYISSEEVNVDDDTEKFPKEHSQETELKALKKPQSIQKENEMKNM